MKISHRHLVGFFLVVALFLVASLIAQREDSHSAAPPPTPANVSLAESTASPPTEFTATDLSSALTEVCSTGNTEAADKEWTQEEIQAQIDAFDEQKRRLSEQLALSSSAEHLHLAALLEADPGSRFELLESAISKSSDPFLVWNAVQLCSEAIKTTPCPLRDWEQLLIAVDGQNSESWVRIAANRYAAQDHDAALDAMQYASTAAESRAYWTEMIEMMERGFAAGSDYAFAERASMAFGFAAAELPRYGDYVKMCEERSAQSTDWAYACLAYGELVENQGKTEIGVAISRDIQRLALEGLGEAEKASEVRQRQQQRSQERLESIQRQNPAVERLVFSNPALFSAYLSAIRSEGEETARRQIVIEVERLIERQPALACEHMRVR